MKKNLTIKERLSLLEEIKKELIKNIGNDLMGATVYGSTLCEDFCIVSDIDILLIFRKIELKYLGFIKKLVKKYKDEKGLRLDINIHTEDETPKVRGDIFWHNNRSIYMQKEASLYGMQLIGDSYLTNTNPEEIELKKECVRIVHSFKYHVRKFLIKEDNSKDEIRQAVKFCLYGVLYFLAYYGIFPKTKLEAYKLFDKKFKFKTKSVDFYKMKVNKPLSLTRKELLLAYNFLVQLDNKIFTDYSLNIKTMGALLLTSDSFSNPNIKSKFTELVGDTKTKNVAIVTTATKDKENNKYAQLTYGQMKDMGFAGVDFVDFEKGQGNVLDKYDVVYVCGGNTFSLLKHSKDVAFGESIKKLMDRGGVYVGVSAGSLVVGPSVQIANEVKPDINTVGLLDFSGLNLIDHVIFPHYKIENEVDLVGFEKRSNTKVRRLANGEALLIANNLEEIIR